MKLGIKFVFEKVGEVRGVLDSSLNPKTVDAILSILPINSSAMTWGGEIYFSSRVDVGYEDSRIEFSIGDIAYWPPGNAICLFFGPTPASRGTRPRTASPANLLGKILDQDIDELKIVEDGYKVKVLSAPH